MSTLTIIQKQKCKKWTHAKFYPAFWTKYIDWTQTWTHLICKSKCTRSTYPISWPALTCSAGLGSTKSHYSAVLRSRTVNFLSSPIQPTLGPTRLQQSLRSAPHLLPRHGCVLTDMSSGVFVYALNGTNGEDLSLCTTANKEPHLVSCTRAD